MIEITYYQMLAAITVIWVVVRSAACLKNKSFKWKREIRLLLFYICIVVIARFVYFPLHRVDGRIGTLIFDPDRLIPPWLNLTPLTFTRERYDGWQINVIGKVSLWQLLG